MNIKEVKELLQEIIHSDISQFELEHTGTKLKVCRGYAPTQVLTPPAISAVPAVTPATPPKPAPEPPAAPAPAATPELPEAGLHIITSPIVGTFYRASSPGAEPYVEVGQTVEEGTILCVVEAMKLMNEIPSDVAGEIVRIYVENSHPVEFGQKLFALRPRK